MKTSAQHRFPLILTMLGVAALAVIVTGPRSAIEPEETGVQTVSLAQEAAGEFPDAWFYPDRNTGQRRAIPKLLEGKAAPALKLKGWIGEPQDLEALKGRVVIVDFWATWCRPCMQAIPKNVALMKKYEADGLSILGVHDGRRGYQSMPAVAERLKVNYPLAIDDGGQSVRAWRVTFWPLYAVVDHLGNVRAAGLRPDRVENVVLQLLAERNEQPAAPEADQAETLNTVSRT